MSLEEKDFLILAEILGANAKRLFIIALKERGVKLNLFAKKAGVNDTTLYLAAKRMRDIRPPTFAKILKVIFEDYKNIFQDVLDDIINKLKEIRDLAQTKH